MQTYQITFRVQGMYCAHCAVELEHILSALEGVFAAYVNYAGERVVVVCNADLVRVNALTNAVERAGYSVSADEMKRLAHAGELQSVHRRRNWKRWLVSLLAGVFSAFALVAVYLGVLTIAQSPAHAVSQLFQYRVWLGLVALGFAVQMGLCMYLRLGFKRRDFTRHGS